MLTGCLGHALWRLMAFLLPADLANTHSLNAAGNPDPED